MSWKIINNSNNNLNKSDYTNECPQTKEKATVTVKFSQSMGSKTDLQPTSHISSRECSLLKYSFASCMETCPLIKIAEESCK